VPSHCRVLLVEDEPLVGLDLAALLEDEGATIVGVAQSVAAAWGCLGKSEMNCALLDINLRGETSFAIADALAEAGVPFAFVTACMDSVVPRRYRDIPIIRKPFITSVVLEVVTAVVGREA